MWYREEERDVHLTTAAVNCHSVFKGCWTHWQSGATDGQPGGAAFESQWHLQYGQSAAQQAHQSKSTLPSRYVGYHLSLTKPEQKSAVNRACEKANTESKVSHRPGGK